MNHIFDSHAHYFDARFGEYPGGADALLHTLLQDRVSWIVNVGTNQDTSRLAVAQAAEYGRMYAAVGIHPEDCHTVSGTPEEALTTLRELLGTEETRRRDKIVAVGEIGLDYHAEQFGDVLLDKAREAFFFNAQMEMAKELDLPVIVHDRDAHGDCFEIVLRHPGVRGVFHSYSGSAEMARELVRRGWYISFSGTLTFKNAERVREVATSVPRDRLLVETDCPYLAPHPFRGCLNHSGLLVHTLTVLASLWNCSPQEAADQTAHNACNLFLLPEFV